MQACTLMDKGVPWLIVSLCHGLSALRGHVGHKIGESVWGKGGQTINDQQPQPEPYEDGECAWTAALSCPLPSPASPAAD